MEEEIKDEVPEEVEEEPEFICGVTLLMMREGQGIRIQPLEGKTFARVATLNDWLDLASQFKTHTESIQVAEKVSRVLENAGVLRKKGGLIH